MKNLFLTLLATILSMTVCANDYDLNKPFGFGTVSARTALLVGASMITPNLKVSTEHPPF